MVECPRCHAENRDDSKYCSSCAAPLNPGVHAGPHDASFTKTFEPPLRVLKAGTLVSGKYRIVEEVGAGGMGVVYRAEDLRLKRPVALKFLPPHLMDSPELKERFLIEAQAAAALSHPNVCVIHEVGESGDRPYIAMEYVEGETLRDRIRRGPLKTEEALDIAVQVAAGLGEAHNKGIIHRDIKSANIMITAKGQAKVMDFGLAKLRGGSSLTRSQTTLGTVAYMSPEQARGEEVDGRTDLWSLGIVLYEMLTGELPFRGDRDLSVIHSIIHEEPRPIKQRKPPVPEELQQVISRALKKNRDSRYGAAGEMLKDLRTYDAALQAEAAGVFNLRSLMKKLRRPAVAIPVALAIVVVAALAIWFFNHQAKVRWARAVALPEIERMIEANDAWRNLVPPYRLAEKAEAIIPRDPKLAELFSKCSLNIDIRTEPPGAGVSIKEYGTPDAEWTFLGTTPLEKIRLPVGIFRWKLEKEGHETVLAAASTWNVSSAGNRPGTVMPQDLVRTLDAAGIIPPGMVRVAGAETPAGILPDFFIDRCEVTNRQYKEFIEAGGYRNRALWKHPIVRDGREFSWDEVMRAFVDLSSQPGPSTWQAGDYPDGEADHPVSGISWYEAAAYAEFAGKSLPTSLHWNAARGAYTPMIRWPQLGGFAVIAPFCNFGGRATVPVGSLPGLTSYGALDLAGNVREWCWNESPLGRIVRGGAWGDNPYEFNNQRQAPPMDRSPKNGVRCALYPDREDIPDQAFEFVNLGQAGDLALETSVPDPIFQIYKGQFSYDRTELEARVVERVENPAGWVREKVSFDAAYGGEKVSAHLFLPANARPPFQAVVYFPGGASTWERSSRDIESFYEFTMFLSFLVKNGRAVLYPVYKGTFERGNPALSAIHTGADTHAFTEFTVQAVKDLRRSLDYLETRPDIDGTKLVYYGMSWGGWLGPIATAVEDRFKAGVLVGGRLQRLGRPEIRALNYAVRVRMPILMLNGRYDNSIDSGIRPLYDLLGTPAEHKRLILYDTDHIPPRNEFIKEILAWLDRYLGPVRRL